MTTEDKFVPVAIDRELSTSYLSYAMSVIVDRALPDVRDGLKPVHRRIVYAMHKGGYYYGRPYRKTARIVGDVIGCYHPHSDTAIYDSLVRMAQDFSLRATLVDGQGNFGSIDGDPAASMRYTESRMTVAAHILVSDIEEDTVEFKPNYDGAEFEPAVLPAEFPNILVNGASGVAVGVSTNIPTHNVSEVIDGCVACLQNPEISTAELMKYIPGPDFPTGGVIVGAESLKQYFETGKANITLEGKVHSETIDGRRAIVIDEIPYQVNKTKLLEKITELIKSKRIEGISEVRDESDKSGIRVVIELKKNVHEVLLLKQIMSLTQLRSNFPVNMLVLNNKRPELMSVREIIDAFLEFRHQVLSARTKFRLRKAREKAHELLGLYVAVTNIDEIITIIRSSADTSEAKSLLMQKNWEASKEIESMILLVSDTNITVRDGIFYFTETQVKAILDIKLQKLTKLEKQKVIAELQSLVEKIEEYKLLLSSKELMQALVIESLLEVKKMIGSPRKTEINLEKFDYTEEELVEEEQIVVTVTVNGYIKRTNLDHYRVQRRGGKGRLAQSVKEEDVVSNVFALTTHATLLFFSNLGKVYKLVAYKLPSGEPGSRGRALVNIFPMLDGEKITSIMKMPKDDNREDMNILFVTSMGRVRKNALSDFLKVPVTGKIAIKLSEGDALVGVEVCSDFDHAIVSTAKGKSVRFAISDLRVFKSRSSEGVRAIQLIRDKVISMSVLQGANFTSEQREMYLKVSIASRLKSKTESGNLDNNTVKMLKKIGIDTNLYSKMLVSEELIMVITENGYGKITSAYEYRVVSRGSIGVVNIITSKRNGAVVACFPVNIGDSVALITSKGKMIRISTKDVRVIGRNTQGVLLFKMEDEERVVSVSKIVELSDDKVANKDDDGE